MSHSGRDSDPLLWLLFKTTGSIKKKPIQLHQALKCCRILQTHKNPIYILFGKAALFLVIVSVSGNTDLHFFSSSVFKQYLLLPQQHVHQHVSGVQRHSELRLSLG